MNSNTLTKTVTHHKEVQHRLYEAISKSLWSDFGVGRSYQILKIHPYSSGLIFVAAVLVVDPARFLRGTNIYFFEITSIAQGKLKGLDINLKGVVVIVGNYGSGKTEVAVNLGIKRKRDGVDVLLADLDLVNPYFRTREARSQLSDLGIEVILPPRKYHNADLPILSPKVGGLIRKPAALSILDAGGDGVGTRVLAALADMFRERPVEMLQVINPFRPFTTDVEGCLVMRDRIEAASHLKVTGLIGNAHLLGETLAGDVLKGYALVTEVSRASGLPVVFITASADLIPAVQASGVTCPILPIERQMVPPW
jgi:hypothetical protein